ncbi:MacB family efflux pump subunit [Actinobacillus lignieresii]|uniref:Pyoverdine export ATP-binding/permease protein PvdT n=1 Tax=Actinobacillus lignieresii TaxID=720 RepID=A0A380U3H6_ACTLI|nr:MacB family efflux pump subunit [Actinobacillus lignieresii]SUT95767.1 ABC transporter ATP-binding protein [Actinobacillus lignieresii]SUU00629.1 ABC transporter ATP-binding protein [Actinobacillus lignieresii]VEB27399.1 ABC transporter ATP-binding protein [Actinobacillus lignieresii]
MKQPLIELKNIERRYRNGNTETTVLKSVNLKVYAGEMIAIVGASGSGKSTLMNILGALDIADCGEYWFRGRNIASLSNDELAELRCSHFGFVFQRYHLLPHLSAIGNVEVPAIYSATDKYRRTERAKELLCRLGLEKQLENKPSQLSGGQQQRVSIARALMNGGEIILADEPTGALDSQSSQEVLNVLKELNAQGHTIILITHDMNIAQNANRIIKIKDGEIIADNSSYCKNSLSPSTKQERQSLNCLMSLRGYKESFVMAFSMMRAHKIRTFLTMLGIIIGIAAVVCVVALGEGTKHKVLNEFSSLGSNTIDIFPGKNWGDTEAYKIQTLNSSDVNLLRQQPYVKGATPNLSLELPIRFLNKTANATINGVSQDFFMLKNYKLLSGRFFNQQDVDTYQAVGIIDKKSRDVIFGTKIAESNIVFIGDVPISIIGVVESASQTTEGQRTTIWLPYNTMAARLRNQPYFQQITVQLRENFVPAAADKAIVDLLAAKHGRKDFFTFSSSKFLQSLNRTTQALTLMISSIAFISLVVGGIGVMNIMLVSVIERTKEIGIRIAVGAKEKDILHQFLIESATVSLIGGIIGILLSLLFGLVFSLLTDSIKMQFTFSSFFIAFLCSSLIGIIFGYFPARNAARLKPIEALSRE